MHLTGPEAAVFHAHETLLTTSSLVLRRAVRELGSAPSNRRIFLDNIDPKGFNIYLNWLYKHAIAITDADGTEQPQNKDCWPKLIKHYVLSMRLEDADFADACTDAMISYFSHAKRSDGDLWFLDSKSKHLLYSSTRPTANARRLLVQMYAHVRDPVLLDERDPVEFLAATSKAMMNGAAEDPLLSAAACSFHEHGDSRACYRMEI